jgi:hypothetical protein
VASQMVMTSLVSFTTDTVSDVVVPLHSDCETLLDEHAMSAQRVTAESENRARGAGWKLTGR